MRALLPVILLLPAFSQDLSRETSGRDPVLSQLLKEEEPAREEEALLVTGKPPTESVDNEAPEIPAEPTPSADESSAASATPDASEPKGVRIRVQEGASSLKVAKDQISLKAPFQPKVLGSPPVGWRFIESKSVPEIEQQATLANGTEVTLSVRPYLLVPDANGSNSFALTEPGFDAEKGYAQSATMGSVLMDSIQHLDADSDRLAAASRRLSELLNSLPAPVPTAAAEEPSAEEKP
ncbi:hypothetical protein HNR46_002594 [Haloferula luteola]|uniref:Uncharacterized protein n=1 Tax=Haloferula luteola TaxID=595692 RepID=A0A840VEU0_9BACT|nr:hypothetical protein [Haloferula luteola]MBB5352349.1 hypothetical protein [Haloferula luteola]